MQGGIRTKSKYQGCNLDDEDDWHEFKNGKNYSFATCQYICSIFLKC